MWMGLSGPYSPQELADYHKQFITEYGVRLVGGCCGTTYEHIKAETDGALLTLTLNRPERANALNKAMLEEIGTRIRNGTSYQQILSALMLAGVRSIQPRPVGFRFHCVLVVNSAHLASLARRGTFDVLLLDMNFSPGTEPICATTRRAHRSRRISVVDRITIDLRIGVDDAAERAVLVCEFWF